MAMKDLQGRYVELINEGTALAAKAETNADDLLRIEAVTAECAEIKGKIEALKAMGQAFDYAKLPANMLPMARPGAAEVVGSRPAGEATVEERTVKGTKSILVNDDGEMLIDEKTYKAITSPDYNRAFKSYLRYGQQGIKADAVKVLQEGLDTSGGYLVPEEILNRLISKEPTPTNLAARVSILNTNRDSLAIPRVVYTTDNSYTSGMRVTWTGEIPAAATTHRVTEPAFGQVRIPIFTAMMSLPLTNDMVEDSATDIVGWCTSKFQETADLLFDNMIINGTGVAQPDGVLINAQFIANDVHTTAAAALTWAGLQSLAFALPEQYDRNAVFAMNKTNCALAISQLQDGNGRPYWTTGSGDYGLEGQTVRQKTLMGYPVIYNAFMPNVGAGTYPIVFGDLSGYYLVRRIGFSIQVLRELYAETNQVLLLGKVRFGGQLVEDWRVRGQVVAA